MTRPALRRIPLDEVWPPARRCGLVYATMSRGQWDGLLAVVYDSGGVLLEVDDHERIVAAYRRQDPLRN
jgi:hypothetical protein